MGENNINCLHCGKKIERKPYANNIKFCSVTCRSKMRYQTYVKDWVKKRRDAEASIQTDAKVQCQICGKWYIQVGSHIWNTHKMTARDYRKEYGFDVKRGQTRGWYHDLKAERAYTTGGIENLLKGVRFWFKKGQEGVGVYQRSSETLARLKNLSKNETK